MATSMADLGFNIDSSPMRRATRDMQGMTQQSRRTEGAAASMSRAVMSSVAAWVSVGAAVAGVSTALRGIVRTSEEFARNQLRTEALLKATGNTAGRTATQLRRNAEALALGTLQSVEGVERAQQTLLTFRAISGETFDRTISLAADLATVMGSDLNSAVLQLGKALEDPNTGLTALRRSGVSFTESQQDVIKSLVETGRQAEAQRMILGELEQQVGGVAGAEASGLSGAFDTLSQRFQDLQRNLGDLLDSNARLQAFINGFASFVETMAEGASVADEMLNDRSGSQAFERALQLTMEISRLQSELESMGDGRALEPRRQNIQYNIDRLQRQLDIARKDLDEAAKRNVENARSEVQAYESAREGARKREAQAQQEAHALRLAQIEEEKQKRIAALRETYNTARDAVDPLGAEFAEIGQQIMAIQELLAFGEIAEGEAERLITALVEGMAEAGEEGGDEFVNQWQSAADRVAQSLQDAIASGDWDKLGDAIGNALAASIAGIVNKTITDSLAKDLTANSSTLAQIGAAFAGPIAGAVAGGAIQLAVSELSDFFSLGDWDPTAERQASQGTGTVLGSIDAKSESIAKATDLAATASRELVGINRNMLRALQAVQLGIGGASARVARGAGDVSLPGVSAGGLNFDVTGGIIPIFDQTLGAAFDFFDKGLNFLTFGALDLGGLLGGKSRQVDEGVQIIGGYITDLIDETIVNAYATFRVKKNAFRSTKTKEQFQRIGGDVEQQFQLVFESLLDSVVAGADVLGVDAMAALEGFRVETQRLSLENLSASEQQAELEAYFGTVFDDLAGAAIPFLDDFQRAGEGLGETLARVATQVQVTEQAVDMLGLRFSSLAGAELIEASQRLVELGGGLDQFISSMQNFIGNFATEAQQFEINANALTKGMGDLPLPETREGFWALMQAQDAATKEGAENIATLLRLQGTADQYYSAIEKAQESYYQTEIQGQQARLSEAQRANRAVQSAMDSMLFQSSAVQEASRQGALRTLEQIANSGRVNNIGQLQSALDAATQIDAGNYSTFADYAREFARTSGVVGRVGDVTQQAEDREARMLRSLENQLEAVKGLRDDLERSQLAIIKQTNKTAKILERFEIDGIEVRA